MKILLNVESLAPPLSGIGTYTLNIANQLERHPDVSSTMFFTRPAWAARKNLELERIAKRGIPNAARRMLGRMPFGYRLRDKISSHLLRRANFAREGYVYHEPNYISVPYEGPSVVTISDLSHIHFPTFHPTERTKRLNRYLVQSVGSAQQVICHSHFIRDEIIDLLSVNPAKVNVIYHGVNDEFHPRLENDVSGVLKKYNLPFKGYLLSVGTIEPRKNLVRLIEAFHRLPERLRKEFPLVIVGPMGWRTARIKRAFETLMADGSLRVLGYVPGEDLPAVYAGAAGFAYISLYEGFGLPLIEAMASGVPLLTSDRSAMPEIAGEAAMLCNPVEPESIEAGLLRLLTDEAARTRHATAGLERAKNFSWKETLDATVAIYRKAQGG